MTTRRIAKKRALHSEANLVRSAVNKTLLRWSLFDAWRLDGYDLKRIREGKKNIIGLHKAKRMVQRRLRDEHRAMGDTIKSLTSE